MKKDSLYGPPKDIFENEETVAKKQREAKRKADIKKK